MTYTHRIARPTRPRIVRPARSGLAGRRSGAGTAADKLTALQRTAGNRAVTALVQQTVQRDAESKEAVRVAALELSYHNNVTAKNWAKAAQDLNGFNDDDTSLKVAALSHDQLIQMDTAARKSAPGWSGRVTTAIAAHDAEADRVGKLTADYEIPLEAGNMDAAVLALNGFDEHDILDKAGQLGVFQRNELLLAAIRTSAGGGRMVTLLQALGSHTVEKKGNETVGGNEFVFTEGYSYHLTPDAIVVDVGLNFDPDDGVTVPVAQWFGYITSTWNRFTAVNEEDLTDTKHIDFNPQQGDGHDIDVHAGAGRANAKEYYVGSTGLDGTVPHEFGHLIGLEDEYERDPMDYTRVTDDAPTIGTSAATPAGPHAPPLVIAAMLHDALFIGEDFFQWHKTAERNRMAAFDAVLAADNITPDYHRGENPVTNQISHAYYQTYGHDMVVDVMDQVDSGASEFHDWREKTLGSFEETSSSIMGDKSDHTHPVAPRHVRKFAEYIQKMLGRGRWTPRETR